MRHKAKVKVANWLKRVMKKNILLWKLYDIYFSLHNKRTLKKYRTSFPLPNMDAEEPTLANMTSQLVTTSQCFESVYSGWCDIMRSPARMNRKQWEFVYILEGLRKYGCIAEQKRGLGFGCGQEPIPAILAKYGCDVVATDLDFDTAYEHGWATTQQHAASRKALNPFGMCPNSIFEQRVSFRVVNMNAIPPDLTEETVQLFRTMT